MTRLDVILVKRFVGVRHCLSEPDKEAEGANGLALLHQNQEPGSKFTAKEQYIPSFSLSVWFSLNTGLACQTGNFADPLVCTCREGI